ncbi:integrase/recombinase XerD [Desulfotomaculum arcticum]|uniref:Integrase/recombinase XerD n=1 Tax=Desulfotruncus arcticus DSM 17038 TaxID=1121424 RepID=A0A1I2X1S9_9FIRM|nr:tyrosine-type recombinase/integrase [Desulfotruncus arcticus]SFH07488.1 integrase/recombinase XerD [Desulfotomaculum arcticum] [Desulfotruncus arcticus DSM 17038]
MLRKQVKNYLIELKMKGSSEHTVKNYGYHFDKFITYMEENNLNYIELTAKQFKKFRNRMVEQGLKPRTINAVLSALKSFYDFLVEERLVPGNPIITRRLRVKEGQSLPDFMTTEELKVFSEWLSAIPGHAALGFRTMLATGMRVSEAASVTPNDIIVLDNGGYIFRVRHGKGDKERYVPVTDSQVVNDLITYTGDRRDDDPLFGITSHAFKWWARKCRLETGINFHSHRCRHTLGTQLLQRGISIDKVQDVLGHADISTTRRYAKTAPEAIYELAAKVDELKERRALYRYWLR